MLGVPLFLAGCVAIHRTRTVEPYGFLRDSSMLEKGRKDEALLIYTKKGVDFATYKQIMLDPVTVWLGANTDLRDMPAEQRQQLADYLYQAIRKQLERNFKVVDSPGRGILHLRVAIVDAKASNAALDTISAVVPVGIIISNVKRLTNGTHLFVGRVAIEAELRDSVSGERLAAAVDQRVGQKRLRGVTQSWDDVFKACDYWAERIAQRLVELQERE